MWFRVDDKFPDHPKARGLEGSHLALWLCMGCWSSEYETDGKVPRATAYQLAARFDPQSALLGGEPPLLARLCVVPPECDTALLERTETGYALHDFLDYNPSRKSLESERRRKRLARRRMEIERRKAHRVRVSGNRNVRGTSGERPAPVQHTRDGVPTRPGPSRPSTESTKQVPAGSHAVKDAVKNLVDLYREQPGVTATDRDGGVIAGIVSKHGAPHVERVIRQNGPMIGAAQYPLQYLVKACEGEAARSSLSEPAKVRPAVLDEHGPPRPLPPAFRQQLADLTAKRAMP